MILTVSVIFVPAVMAVEQQSPASAAPTASKFEKFKGVVERVDEAKKDIVVKSDKEEMTFSLTDKTRSPRARTRLRSQI